MASGGETSAPAEDEGGVPLDIDDVHFTLTRSVFTSYKLFGHCLSLSNSFLS